MGSKRNETLKKRYQVYRRLGYDSRTSSVLSHRELDVSNLEISKKTGKLKRNTATKDFINTGMRDWKRNKVVDGYVSRTGEFTNDTTLTRHGMMTHDPRYKGENGKIVSIIKTENKLSRDQAYYFYYIMTQSGMTYKQTKEQLLSNKEFEEYDKNKKLRNEAKQKQRQAGKNKYKRNRK